MTRKAEAASKPNNGHCTVCRHYHEFELPKPVLEAARTGRLVVFAGAGVSTENASVMPYTFYDEVAQELGHDPKKITTSFSALMSELCAKAGGRRQLLQMIKARFDYIESFPSLIGASTRFHQELCTIQHLDEIITTNWDPYFERFCGATPFVSPEDFVFWNTPGRKVFKLHGSVHSYGSIVATDADYERCHQQLANGLVGSNLKMLLATKVVLFAGYSLRDHDFLRIYNFLRDEMKDMLPRAYVITISAESAGRFEKLGLHSVVTDGTHFIQVLKKHLVAANYMIDDQRFDAIEIDSNKVFSYHLSLHSKLNTKKNPELIYCASYQDGLLDAFGRIGRRFHTGEYSCQSHIAGLIRKYLEMQQERQKTKRFADVAYIEGYINGLFFLVGSDSIRKQVPLYYLFGYEESLRTFTSYKKAARNAEKLHPAAYKKAAKLAKKLPDGMEYHHTPLLL